MDKIRFATLAHRSTARVNDESGMDDVDPRALPRTYDLIHVSNIPSVFESFHLFNLD